ncbi:MAG: hypothetical protein K1X88_20815 [Nannocystaceae bacterium]|nr:hypothetical protein [Nannocystaceae bacterium]
MITAMRCGALALALTIACHGGDADEGGAGDGSGEGEGSGGGPEGDFDALVRVLPDKRVLVLSNHDVLDCPLEDRIDDMCTPDGLWLAQIDLLPAAQAVGSYELQALGGERASTVLEGDNCSLVLSSFLTSMGSLGIDSIDAEQITGTVTAMEAGPMSPPATVDGSFVARVCP